ncbi:Glutaredoxin-C6 [Yarrowia sp. C11]|nr:Glutaredoxin-C6 [Yarrowia sp. E02]KAG5371316.1 Glutaredoxin-C6 [Yarrowia sp. C11]
MTHHKNNNKDNHDDELYIEVYQKYLEKARRLIEEHKVLVVALSWSDACEEIKTCLQSIKGELEPFYLELDKEEAMDRVELQKAFVEITSSNAIPSVFVKGKHIGSGEEVIALFHDKKLPEVLEEAGIKLPTK